MINQKTKLTLDEAYASMYKFLEHELEMIDSDDIRCMLGGMSLLEDGGTADPAVWGEWIQSIEKVLDGDDNIKLQITTNTNPKD